MHTTIKFAKVKPNAIIPSKRIEDAGYDVYACFEEENFIISPFRSELVPTGIASAFDSDYGLVFRERGSTGIKNIKINAGVIDSGFRNEIFVCIYNANPKPLMITKETNSDKLKNLENDFIVYPYTKAIAQGILLPVPTTDVEEYTYEELQKIPSERGKGMLGSSNK